MVKRKMWIHVNIVRKNHKYVKILACEKRWFYYGIVGELRLKIFIGEKLNDIVVCNNKGAKQLFVILNNDDNNYTLFAPTTNSSLKFMKLKMCLIISLYSNILSILSIQQNFMNQLCMSIKSSLQLKYGQKLLTVNHETANFSSVKRSLTFFVV